MFKQRSQILDFEEEALRIMHGDQNILFMTSTIRRQAASCIFGLAPCVRAIIDRRFNQLDGEDFEGALSVAVNKLPAALLDKAKKLIRIADDIPEDDPKLDSLMDIVHEVNARDHNKIILFSSFRHTLAYLLPKLKAEGLRVAQVDGSVNSEERLRIRKRFELERTETEALDMLLFTEVGSEGLDYQFCDTIVNYDLPWNPMRIEQRIGRIDRRGQKSSVVHIYNMMIPRRLRSPALSMRPSERSDCSSIIFERNRKAGLRRLRIWIPRRNGRSCWTHISLPSSTMQSI